MHELTKLIKDDMKIALGVTEPGAIAFAVSKCKSYLTSDLEKVSLKLNSGIYKNAFTCGIPNSNEFGNLYAAALGAIAGDYTKNLESLENVTKEDNILAQKLIDENKINIELNKVSSDIYIECTLESKNEVCTLIIEDSHTNITKIILNDKIIFEKEKSKKSSLIDEKIIHKYTFKELLTYVNKVDLNEIEFIKEAFIVNMDLFYEGLKNPRTTFIKELLKLNNNQIFSQNILSTAQLLCNGAIEARVLGLNKPAMSITGSGAHGIITTLPIYAEYKIKNLSEEVLLRATLLSYLVCTYIKEYSGKLSAFCGCGIAGGIGAACGIAYLRNATEKQMFNLVNNIASGITGMICDGGNQGCVMKGIVALDTVFRSVELALNNIFIHHIHGINGKTIEETFKNIGKIASPGMVETEKVLVEIFQKKDI